MKNVIKSALIKIGLKKTALKVYFAVNRTWGSIYWSGLKTVNPILVRRRSRKGVYAIDLDSDWLGLGARIIKTLEILLYCEQKELTPVIRYNYLEGNKKEHDFFGELFFYRNIPSAVIDKASFTAVRDTDELGWDANYNQQLTLTKAKSLFDKYLGIQPDILEEVDAFISRTLPGESILGVHYRGTDKAGEAPLVAKDRLLDQIRDVLKSRPQLSIIFVSTDDQKIIDFLRKSDLPIPVVYREDAVRSQDGDQFHRKKEVSKSTVNRDAIVNMLLLSRCDFLLKTASILSDCSIVFNPEIPVKVISFPHSDELTWWPATEIKNNQEKGKYSLVNS